MNFSQKEFDVIQNRLIPAARLDRNSNEANVSDWEAVLEMASCLGFNIQQALANFNRLRLEVNLPKFEVDTIESQREMCKLFDAMLPGNNSLQKLNEDFAFLQKVFTQ